MKKRFNGKEYTTTIKCKTCGEEKPWEESGANTCNECWEKRTKTESKP